jgi:hypothetical protein
MTAYADELFRLVDNLCTADQVQGLLRTVKGQKDVRITAENKSDLIERNLRAAVGSRALSLDQVYELVRTAEENGNQHIFISSQKAAGSQLIR